MASAKLDSACGSRIDKIGFSGAPKSPEGDLQSVE